MILRVIETTKKIMINEITHTTKIKDRAMNTGTYGNYAYTQVMLRYANSINLCILI